MISGGSASSARSASEPLPTTSTRSAPSRRKADAINAAISESSSTTGSPTKGSGLLVTSTLLFAGEGSRGEPVLRAYNKRTGDVVHEIQLPGGPTTGFPITYMAGSQQYIVVAALDEENIAELVAFTVQ